MEKLLFKNIFGLLLLCTASCATATYEKPTAGVGVPETVLAKKLDSYDKQIAKYQNKIAEVQVKQRADFEKKLLRTVKRWYGVKYEFGSQNKKAIDCAGFVQAVYQKMGYDIQRSSILQYGQGYAVPKGAGLKIGDLVFYNTHPQRGQPVSHVGIYLGNNKMVHAGTSTGVADIDIDKMARTCPAGYQKYYVRRYVAF